MAAIADGNLNNTQTISVSGRHSVILCVGVRWFLWDLVTSIQLSLSSLFVAVLVSHKNRQSTSFVDVVLSVGPLVRAAFFFVAI